MFVPVQTPELLADVEVPESVSILGQTVDLSQVRSLLQPVSQGLSGIITQVGAEALSCRTFAQVAKPLPLGGTYVCFHAAERLNDQVVWSTCICRTARR